MRHSALVLLCLSLLSGTGGAEESAEALGWTTSVHRLEGSARRPWYLALVFHKTPKVVTMIVAPAATAGDEGKGIDVDHVERSGIGDLHQIAAWAERLRKEAEGWKRPSLRARPPASPHVIGVVYSASGPVQVENAEHGGGPLRVGDFLFVEDVVASGPEASFGIELVGKENLWEYRNHLAALRGAHATKIGLRGTSEALQVRLHRGALEGRTGDGALALLTERTVYTAGPESVFLLSRRATDRLDLETGTVRVAHGTASATVVGGSTLTIEGDEQTIEPLSKESWAVTLPPAAPCSRKEALDLVDRLAGTWRGQQLKAQLTLHDDGRWKSYERQPGRSINKGGSWEPLPGGLVRLTYVWTHHRSKTTKTEHYRYVLDGHVLRRLVPSGPVYLKK